MNPTTIHRNSSVLTWLTKLTCLNWRLAALALLAILFSYPAHAQAVVASPQQQSVTAPKINLIIERNSVRFDQQFDAQGSARTWQLEVFSAAGDLMFASGTVSQPAIEWPLADQTGKPLTSGLYAYTLKFWNENNDALPTQRGHVIVDRASTADRIWVASSSTVGVGSTAELTVAGSPEATVGGAQLPSVPTRNMTQSSSDLSKQSVSGARGAVPAGPGDILPLPGNITGLGTTGFLPRFTSSTTLGNSAISEDNGNIRINTNSVFGKLTVINSTSRGVYGRSDSAAGVWGQSISAQGVYGLSTSSAGVEGSSITGVGSSGVSSSNYGVYGTTGSANFAGVFGSTNSANGKGIWGRANNGSSATGVFGESTEGRGVFGDSQTGTGVRGESNSGTGVYGYSNSGRGVYGNSLQHHGVYGRSLSGDHAGVYGFNLDANGVGVLGEAQGGINQTSIGVYGKGSGWGVVGVGEAGHGVAGYGSFLGASIYGASGAAWAGYFDGNVVITGTLDSNNFAGTFASKVDHPLDPANKYLNQSFIESAEMMTVQTGNVTTDANGEANVTLPDYFQAMNGDFRYQLTVVGQFAQAIVGQKIEGNRFTIKTDKPHVEVSWQVTGLRRDATTQASRKPVEELKPESERGHYLRPALFNQPEEKSVEWARHPEMMKRVKAEREQKQTTKRQQ